MDASERGDRGWKQAQKQGDFTDNFTVNRKHFKEGFVELCFFLNGTRSIWWILPAYGNENSEDLELYRGRTIQENGFVN